MRMETFIRKGLRLKAHSVVKVEEDEAAQELIIHLDRREHRRLYCGECGRAARRIAPTRRPARRWRDLALRKHIVVLVYAPYRVRCSHCGLRVEPWRERPAGKPEPRPERFRRGLLSPPPLCPDRRNP